ncbi:MAG TPA: radical SAM protein [Myxococcota bacterium]|nr:radical SAM protein [Myxococcota bacterium]
MAILAGQRIPRLDFELTAGCDHRCAHCYNVWGAEPGDPQHGYAPRRMLDTTSLLALMTKAVRQSGCTHLTITGGEPLLRRDAEELITHACRLVPSVNLITNGSHLDAARAGRLARAGLRSVQLTLLAGDRALHDRLKGAVCFDDTTRAAFHASRAGVVVSVCYVAMAENAGQLTRVLDLCAALGVRHLSYNRMSPTGGAVHHVARLMPTPEQIEADLEVCEVQARRLGIRVGTAMPIPPCIVRTERYPWVTFGGCSTGTDAPNLVVDVLGNVRSCNLSDTVLGNLVDDDWETIMANPYPDRFRATLPETCRGCAFQRSCVGGCKESSHAVFGEVGHLDPLVWLALRPPGETLPVRQDGA